MQYYFSKSVFQILGQADYVRFNLFSFLKLFEIMEESILGK